jgi:hypothetical protein
LKPRSSLSAIAISALVGLALSAPAVLATDPPDGATGIGLDGADLPTGQDPNWLALKNAHRIRRLPSGEVVTLSATMVATTSYPSSYVLSSTVTKTIVEAQGNEYDDLHKAVSDSNYWNFCGEGATEVALYYWRPTNVTGWPEGNFTEPYGTPVTTHHWRSSDTGTSSDTSNGYATKGRAYEMYLAEQVQPGNTGLLGEFDFYSGTGHKSTHAGRLTDVLNWEASNHYSGYKNYIYTWRSPVSQAQLLADVHTNIYDSGIAVVAGIDTYVSSSLHLPNWAKPVGHAITIIGYNDTTGTYTYTDTCGVDCGSTKNGGTNVVSQTTMWQLISHHNTGYAW